MTVDLNESIVADAGDVGDAHGVRVQNPAVVDERAAEVDRAAVEKGNFSTVHQCAGDSKQLTPAIARGRTAAGDLEEWDR